MSRTEWMIRPGMLPGLLEAAVDGTGAAPRRTARDWVVDLASVTLAAAMASVALLWPSSHWPVPRPVTAVASVLACASMLLRRRFPVVLTMVLVAASIWIPAVSGASMIALFTAAVHRRLPMVMLLVVMAGVSAMAQFSLGFTNDRSSYWLAVGAAVLLSLLVVGWGIAVRGRRELVLVMAERMHRLQAEHESRLREARQAVRDGIARDLHDSLAHRLSLISMSAGALDYRGPVPTQDLRAMVDILRSNARQGMRELRQVVSVLRGVDGRAIPGQHGGSAILDLVADAGASGQEIDLTWSVPTDRLGSSRTDSLYRCVQEGLSNARKHAAGQQVSLTGGVDEHGSLHVEMINAVDDESSGDDNGTGLVGLQERIRAEGGHLSSSIVDGCFRLRAVWPGAVAGDPPGSEREHSR